MAGGDRFLTNTPRIRTEGAAEGLAFHHDTTPLGRAKAWNLVCPYGEFDLSLRPSGFEGGYAELIVHARRVRVEGVVVAVADLADVIRSKEAAGRPKDLRALPILYRHLAARRAAETQGGGGPSDQELGW